MFDMLPGVTYANMLVATQWPLKRAPHLTSLVWVCVLWRYKSSLELVVLWLLSYLFHVKGSTGLTSGVIVAIIMGIHYNFAMLRRIPTVFGPISAGKSWNCSINHMVNREFQPISANICIQYSLLYDWFKWHPTGFLNCPLICRAFYDHLQRSNCWIDFKLCTCIRCGPHLYFLVPLHCTRIHFDSRLAELCSHQVIRATERIHSEYFLLW